MRFLKIPATALPGVVALLMLLGAASALQAQPEPQTTIDDSQAPSRTSRGTSRDASTLFPAMEGPVDPARYTLGPGDELELALWGRVTARVPLVVNAEGSIYAPNLGHIHVSGMTLNEARARVLDQFRRGYRGVRADITLLRPRRIRLHVTGQVEKPGLVEVQSPARASDAVTAAGGLAGEASRRNVEIQRSTGGSLPVDFESYRRLGIREDNPLVGDGDVIQVPVQSNMLEVMGEVTQPQTLEYRSGDHLSRALALAGGLTAAADSDSVEIWRFLTPQTSVPFQASLRSALSGGGRSLEDPLLQPGDRIFVHNQASWHRRATVQVIGEVVRPGPYAISPEGERASQMLQRVGGFTSFADVRNATIYRPSLQPVRDTAYVNVLRHELGGSLSHEDQEFLKIHALAQGNLSEQLRRVYADRDPAADFQLQDGDVIVVPMRTGSVAVYGAVRRPGVVAYRQGAHLRDYIEKVGGYGDQADHSKIRVTRVASAQPIRLTDVTAIDEGDIVWVPEREPRSFLRSAANVMAFMAQLATVYVVIHQARQ